MASKLGLPWQQVIPLKKNLFPESCSPIDFSKSGKIWYLRAGPFLQFTVNLVVFYMARSGSLL